MSLHVQWRTVGQRMGGGHGGWSVSHARVWEGGYPPPTVGTFSKIRVSKSHFKALKKRFSRELNVKFHGEELTKEIIIEYRVKTIHFNTRSIASLARVLRMYIYMDLSKKLMFL